MGRELGKKKRGKMENTIGLFQDKGRDVDIATMSQVKTC